MDASYSFQGAKATGNMEVSVAGTNLDHDVQPTGKTVGEPNSDWVIDSFNSVPVGRVNFPEAGFYDIKVEVSPKRGNNVKFQWLWLEKA